MREMWDEPTQTRNMLHGMWQAGPINVRTRIRDRRPRTLLLELRIASTRSPRKKGELLPEMLQTMEHRRTALWDLRYGGTSAASLTGAKQHPGEATTAAEL
jgi:hypothetical protein